MQRLFTVLSLTMISGLALTGCPEKKAEKEEPATPDTPAAEPAAAGEEKAEEKAEEKKEEPAKEEGGW